MGKAIGIDLGTTNTAVAVLVDGRPRVLEDDKGYKVLPSCVAFKHTGERVVGQAARNLIITQPENSAYAIKRLMGRRFDAPEVREVCKLVSYEVAAADDGFCKIRLGDDWFSPVEVSAAILQVAKGMAERSLGEPVDEAVITVPAYFNHAQRSATFEAARLAGLRCERLLNEPTAAALAYGYRKDVEKRLVVYDLGGGTFDISVLQLARGIYEVLATSGETHLGGEDFDQRIVDHLSEDFLSKTGVDPRTDATALQRLKDAAERAKCELSFTDRTTILIPMITMADSLETALSRLMLEELVEDLIDRTLEITRDAIGAAGLRLADIDDVILVGGQTRMPRVREAIRSLFQKEPSRSVHPEEVVAIGAAVHATSLTSVDAHKPLLLDVTPFDLGIDVAGGLFKKIITANSQVPASFTETFATTRDNQRSVRVTVRQGASPTAKDNEFLGEFVMTGLTAAPRMETKVDVTFKIDSNGMLHASAMEQGSGDKKRITVRNYAEYVQQDGAVVPELEGDLGGEVESPDRPSLQPSTSRQPTAGGEAPKPGFLRRIFGRKDDAPAPAAEASAPAAESPPASDAVPEMPAFLQDLDLGNVHELDVADEEGGPAGLDAVGAGLDSLGLDEFAPLSLSDLGKTAPLSPVPSPVLPAAPPVPSATDGQGGFGADADEGLFVMPDDDDYYDDEDLDDGEALFGGDGFVPVDEDDQMEAYEGAFEDLDEPSEPVQLSEPVPDATSFDDDEEYDDEYDEDDVGEAVFLPDDDDDEVHHSWGFSPPEPTPSTPLLAPLVAPPMMMADEPPSAHAPESSAPDASAPDPDAETERVASGTPETELTEQVSEFEVDDSTRSLVHGLLSAEPSRLPEPNPDYYEENLWTDEDLPDDGTVEFIADGATATPRAIGWEDTEAEVSLPAEETLVDATADWSDHPTDPPIPVLGGARRVLRLEYRTAERLVKDLEESLRRGSSFVATDNPLAAGAECLLEYHAPGMSEPLALPGVVTWSTASGASLMGQPPGMDVEYRIDGPERRALESDLARLGA